jgi:single-strand DNA-binding protein
VNKVIIIGRLGKDPETRSTASGQSVCSFSVATNENYTDAGGKKVEKAEWHNVVVWGKQADFCSNYLSKGRLVMVEGKLQTRKWQDKEGRDRYTTEVVAQRVEGLDLPPKQAGQGEEEKLPF